MEPHVLLVSCPLQGHVNPLLRLGRRLAAEGLLVTFTTFRHAGLRDMPEDGACVDDVVVGHGRLRFVYLRDGSRSPDDPRYLVPGDMLSHVVAVGPSALADLIGRQADAGRPVSFVVNNTFVPWALDVATEMAIPCAMLWIQSCSVLSLYYHFYKSPEAFPTAADKDMPVALPGLPAMTMDELPLMVRPELAQNLWGQMIRAQLGAIQKTVSWVLVNSFYELERSAVEALRAHATVTPIGPLLEHDHYGGGNDGDAPAPHVAEDDGRCMVWLDAQPPRSVVYAAFGSLVNIGRDEMAAMAEGLVSTGRPFLWVVRDDSRELIPEAVLAACNDMGSRIAAWCPQGRVLRHGAVGCFVTHCGWNSITEALAAGVPVVAYPWWSDQFTNAKLLVEDYKVGVRLPAPVTGDELRACIDRVLTGPGAAAIRTRAMHWKMEATAAVAHGGSSDRGLQDFVDHVRRSSGSKKSARLAQEYRIKNGQVNPVLI